MTTNLDRKRSTVTRDKQWKKHCAYTTDLFHFIRFKNGSTRQWRFQILQYHEYYFFTICHVFNPWSSRISTFEESQQFTFKATCNKAYSSAWFTGDRLHDVPGIWKNRCNLLDVTIDEIWLTMTVCGLTIYIQIAKRIAHKNPFHTILIEKSLVNIFSRQESNNLKTFLKI